jgi:hypothetical protein
LGWVLSVKAVRNEVEVEVQREARDWATRAFALERELGEQVDWFDRKEPQRERAEVPHLTREELAVRDILRLVALLALCWHASPQTILLFIAGEAPDEAEWGRLVSKSWDGLSSSQRATLNAHATEEVRRAA